MNPEAKERPAWLKEYLLSLSELSSYANERMKGVGDKGIDAGLGERMWDLDGWKLLTTLDKVIFRDPKIERS